MAANALEVRHLTKRYDEVVAVDDIDFAVEQGGVTALLGGNGAGKTTTIAMLLGLLLPTSGAITVLGEDMLRHRWRVLPRLNFSSPYVDLPHRLSVVDNLRVYGHLYGMPDVDGRIAALARDLDLGELLKRRTGSLSAGQKTRVAIAKALINEPDLLLLDEPTASLDPDTADWIRTYLRDYQRRTGATILLASHNMTEVERLAQDVIMLRKGKIVDRAAPDALLAKYGRDSMEDVFLDIARGRGAGREAAE
jgi:ABC-2 type transport system ATP-binding protein